MSRFVRKYRKRVRSVLEGIATWLPSDHVEVGDVGIFSGNRFHKIKSLSDIGIEFKSVKSGLPQPWKYAHTSSFKIKTTVDPTGQDTAASSVVKGEAEVQFDTQGSYLLHIHNAQHIKLDNFSDIKDAIEKAYEEGRWQLEWHLVDSVYLAERATILVAEGRNASVKLSLSSKIPLQGISLANPELNLSVDSSRGECFEMLGGVNVTPLFTCLICKDIGSTLRGFTSQESPPETGTLRWMNVEPDDIEDEDEEAEASDKDQAPVTASHQQSGARP